MPLAIRPNGRAAGFVGLYLALWGASTAYLAARGADWTFPLISLGVFGIALSGLAFLLTRKARPEPIRVQRPGLELAAVLGFLAIYAVGFLGWGMGAAREVFPPGREQELFILGLKLVVHVAIPALLLALLGAKLAPLFRSGLGKPGFWPPLIVLGAILLALLCVVSPALKQISGLNAAATTLAWAAPAAFIWYALEAGLCEEFLFRAVLQSRLAAVLKTEVGAVAVGSLLFALAHAPGLFLRGTPDTDGWSTDPVQVVAFTIATLSPIAVLFGVLWARTRSLLLVVLLHACVDILPNLAEFVRTWAT
jgi:membrane protease YdiL (CAAX protease family)